MGMKEEGLVENLGSSSESSSPDQVVQDCALGLFGFSPILGTGRGRRMCLFVDSASSGVSSTGVSKPRATEPDSGIMSGFSVGGEATKFRIQPKPPSP